MGQKAAIVQSLVPLFTGKLMSRSALILIILAVIIIGGAVYLSNSATEVPTTRMEQDVTNEALAQ